MNNRVKVILCNSIIHIDIGKRRNADDEDVYEKRLRAFARDKEYASILSALRERDYSLAEHHSQRLKLKSYNLGMVRLAGNCEALCLAIQSGKGAPLFADQMQDLTTIYTIMQDCIGRAFAEDLDHPAKERSRL